MAVANEREKHVANEIVEFLFNTKKYFSATRTQLVG